MYSDILSIVCTVHILIFGRQNTLTLLILPPFDHAPSLYPASSPSCVLLETDDPPGITWGGAQRRGSGGGGGGVKVFGPRVRGWILCVRMAFQRSRWANSFWFCFSSFWKYFWASVRIWTIVLLGICSKNRKKKKMSISVGENKRKRKIKFTYHFGDFFPFFARMPQVPWGTGRVLPCSIDLYNNKFIGSSVSEGVFLFFVSGCENITARGIVRRLKNLWIHLWRYAGVTQVWGQYDRFFNPVTGLNTLRCFLRDFVAAIVVIFRVATLKAYMQGNWLGLTLNFASDHETLRVTWALRYGGMRHNTQRARRRRRRSGHGNETMDIYKMFAVLPK